MQVTRISILTQQRHTLDLDLTPDQLAEIEQVGRFRLIQDIVPHLSPDEREFLLTGITPDEWARHLGDEPEDGHGDCF